MNIHWTRRAWDQYVEWQGADDRTVAKINLLLKDIARSPFKGLGKPEPLRGELSGYWSRRITDEHRLVYRVVGTRPTQHIEITQCRFHY